MSVNRSQGLLQWRRRPLLALGLALCACAGAATRSLPPPEYEEAPLPEWEPPSREPSTWDAALDGGEWVEDEPSAGGAGPGAPEEPARTE